MNTQRIDGHDFDPASPMEQCHWEPETTQEDHKRAERNMQRLKHIVESRVRQAIYGKRKDAK